ncbi:MAG: hypothetical protein NVSMB51_06310 [Solirubrobacteraceae bacterium]
MDTEKTDQQQFDADVSRVGKRALQGLAGIGGLAALIAGVLLLTLSAGGGKRTPAITSASPAGATTNASLVITHVQRGCHAFLMNGGPATSPNATIQLARGRALNIKNNDVMPHQLILTGGGQPAIAGAAMGRMGATSSVRFPTAGTYTFTTKSGEDYTKGITTTGPDNVLKLRVVVSSA